MTLLGYRCRKVLGVPMRNTRCYKWNLPEYERYQCPVVRRFAGAARARRIFRLPFGPSLRFGAHDNCVDNMERAVLERVFYVKRGDLHDRYSSPPDASRVAWGRVRRLIDRLDLPVATPMERSEFPSLYTEPRKRRVYEAAVESLERCPVCMQDAEVNGFVKFEKIMFPDFTVKDDPAPRLIQPRDPRYNVEVGVYLKPIEHRLYHAIDLFFGDLGCTGCTVAKSHNFSKRARVLREKWERFDRPVALLFDAIRFDQHCSVEALKVEHEVYYRCFRSTARDKLRWLLAMQLFTKFTGRTADGYVKFTKPGGRCSGDMNTALGNVLLMCLMMADYLLTIGLTKFELYDDGDDSVLIIEERDLALVEATYFEHFFQLGFQLRLDGVVRVFEQIEFCKTHPVFDGQKWVMIRDPRVAIAKDCISTLPHADEAVIRGWMAAVADCGEAIAGSFPVWDAFYSLLRREAKGVKALKLPDLESGMQINSRGMKRRFGTPTPDARVSFWRAFGWEPAKQVAYECMFDSMSLAPGVDGVTELPQHGGYDYGCLMLI